MNKKVLISFNDYKKAVLKDTEVKGVYDQLKPEYELISAVIKFRNSSKMSQGELAKKMGTRQSAISRFESGQSNPSLHFMQRIARALGKDIKVTLK